MSHFKRVEVTWIDSAFNRGWGSLADKRASMDVAQCRTVGYLLEKTPHTIKLAMSLGDEDAAAEGMAIPMCAVKRIRTLKDGR